MIRCGIMVKGTKERGWVSQKATGRRKFHALKEIAEAKKKGKENEERNLWIDNWIDIRGGQG